ncbi:hypothetical protein BKI52_18385 [marine bacterium AO1-C]|nr:hypothetical protein BKI52_18385 [marine bacterium AO1-C]
MKTTLTILFFLFHSTYLFSQSLSVKSVEDWIKNCGDTAIAHQSKLFVIDGIPFDPLNSKALNDELSRYAWDDPLVYINYGKVNAFHGHGRCFVSIGKAKKLRRQRKKSLRTINKYFQDNYPLRIHHMLINAKDPVLMINDKIIHFNIAKQRIAQLKARKIEYLIYQKKAPQAYYGQNAKNGLVKIYLKGYLQKKEQIR